MQAPSESVTNITETKADLERALAETIVAGRRMAGKLGLNR
jgi:hypothetical protein